MGIDGDIALPSKSFATKKHKKHKTIISGVCAYVRFVADIV
jgi:hypothetical protein